MGWVSECSLTDRTANPAENFEWRWLPRFIIMKGGNLYLFKLPPLSTLMCFKQKLFCPSRRNHSGSSLGSVGSSGSEASNSSNSTHTCHGPNEPNESFSKIHKAKPDRLLKLNKDFEGELVANSVACFNCYKSDFQVVKLNEQCDGKTHCFVLYSGKRIYFSTENAIDLENLQKAWATSNYHSVTKLKVYQSLHVDLQVATNRLVFRIRLLLWYWKKKTFLDRLFLTGDLAFRFTILNLRTIYGRTNFIN